MALAPHAAHSLKPKTYPHPKREDFVCIPSFTPFLPYTPPVSGRHRPPFLSLCCLSRALHPSPAHLLRCFADLGVMKCTVGKLLLEGAVSSGGDVMTACRQTVLPQKNSGKQSPWRVPTAISFVRRRKRARFVHNGCKTVEMVWWSRRNGVKRYFRSFVLVFVLFRE